MFADLASLLPYGLSPLAGLALIVISFFTSAITAVFGLGGGIAMLGALGLFFAPAVVIPLHGSIQLGSNVGRTIVQRRFIQWHLVFWFALGTMAGAFIGGSIAISLPEALFEALIGFFILFSVWGKIPVLTGRGALVDVLAGTVIGTLGMVIGAVGPLVGSFLRKIEDRRQLIATHASVVMLSNLAKVVAFTVFGFAFAAYVPLLLAMIVTGFAGTVLGTYFLDRIDEVKFRRVFDVILTLLALELLRSAIFG